MIERAKVMTHLKSFIKDSRFSEAHTGAKSYFISKYALEFGVWEL